MLSYAFTLSNLIEELHSGISARASLYKDDSKTETSINTTNITSYKNNYPMDCIFQNFSIQQITNQ